LRQHDDRGTRRRAADAAEDAKPLACELASEQAQVRLLGAGDPDNPVAVIGLSANIDVGADRHADPKPRGGVVGQQQPEARRHRKPASISVPPRSGGMTVIRPLHARAR
jgi:hypothetical protein